MTVMPVITDKNHRAATVDPPCATVGESASDPPENRKKAPVLSEPPLPSPLPPPHSAGPSPSSGIRYKRLGTGRRVLLEQLRLVTVLAVTGCLFLAVETTLPGRLRLPGSGAAAPSLSLLFCMAVGFLWREEEGAVTGLCMGFLADATGAGGMMLLPLLYCLCGYLCGLGGRLRLAHNLPSFVVFAIPLGGAELVFAVVRETLRAGQLPPLAWALRGGIPVWLLTVAASPIVYGILSAERYVLHHRDSKTY